VAENTLQTPKNTAVTKTLLAANSAQLPVNSPKPAFFDDTDAYTKVPGVVTTDFLLSTISRIPISCRSLAQPWKWATPSSHWR
jgi:hypothetical protein